MHTTPLLTERDTDLRRAIQAVDPQQETTVLPAVTEPVRDPRHGFVLATAGGVVGLGALALLVALVLATSNDSTRSAVVSPPLAPVTETTTAPAVTTAQSAESTPSPSASAAPPPPSAVDTPPPTAVVSAEKMAPAVPAQEQEPVRTRLRELFPRLFP
jgi:type IV secretory pathway VirB10-like protein